MPFSELRKQLNDREMNKFVLNTDGEHAVRVVPTAVPGATPITVESQVPALEGDFSVVTLQINDTAQLLPVASFVDCRAISIQNKSQTDTIYFSSNPLVTADTVLGVTSGWEIPPNETFNTDIKDTAVIYAITESGKTAIVKLMGVK